MTILMKKPASGLKLAASLALITILGPSAIDMYLASMPDMAREFSTSYASAQLTLTVFLLALGAGQLLFGPLINAYGRRRPLLAGITIFILASLWAASASSIDTLLYARFFQGMAAALTLVVAMSTVRDVCEGARAAQMFALLMTIEGLAPVLAPAIGGYVDTHFGWRGVMFVLAGLGVIALTNTALNLPETLLKNKRLPLKPIKIVQTYRRIAADSNFLLPALALSAAFFFLFAYIGGAALIYQSHFGLAPDTCGLVFGATGVAVLVGALTCARLVSFFGAATLAMCGVVLMSIGAVFGTIAVFYDMGLAVIVIGMFIAMFGLGIAESTLMTMAMSSQHTGLGSTAALLGAFHLVFASAATPIAGFFAEQGPQSWLLFLTGIGLVALFITVVNVSRATHDIRGLAGH